MSVIIRVLSVVLGICSIAHAQGSTSSQLCSIYDSACFRGYIENLGHTQAPAGIPSLGVPVLDPLQLYNVTTNVGPWKLKLVTGECIGISKCNSTRYTIDVENRLMIPEIYCDPIIIKGHFQLIPPPFFKERCGLDLRADGNITITFEQWFMKYTYPFRIVRHDDGIIYIKALFEQATYISEFGRVVTEADGIKLGSWDITKPTISWINQNWQLVMESRLGKFINDQSLYVYFADTYNKIFDNLPASALFSDDFEPLVDY